jgi:ABC-2 type transport system ATP-binding protein
MLQQTINDMSSSEVIASVLHLNKSFSAKKALSDVSLEIHANRVLAILGPNGAGKTTLINILLGRLAHDSGQVSLFSSAPGDSHVKRQSGAMLQVASLPERLKVKEHIRLFQSYYPSPMSYEEVIKYAGLSDLENRYSKKLSGGEKQRLLFALSICGNPRLLFLDEPSVGMDIEARQRLWSAIRDLKAQGTSIILTTHYLPEADALADEIVLLKNGEIIKKGTSEEIKASVSNTTIQFSSSEPLDAFEHLVGVLKISTTGKLIQIQTQVPQQTLQALLSQNTNVEDLEVTKAGLEDAFLQLNQNDAGELS